MHQFERETRGEGPIRSNLRSLFGIEEVPSDSGLRKPLDTLDPEALRQDFMHVFSRLKRSKALEGYAYWEEHHLLSIDGTGRFSSISVRCANCCERQRRDRSKSHGYEFGHNFGHGNCNLSDVLAQLMTLAILINRVEKRCCWLFNAARKKPAG